MLVLVTGVTGRIGQRLAKALMAREGERVRGLVLPNDPGSVSAERSGVEIVYGDLREEGAVQAALRDVDAIYHLGALMAFGDDNPALFEINVRGTFNLMNQAVRECPRLQRLVFASSGEVYPDYAAQYLPTDERHPYGPVSFYGCTKELGERMALQFHRSQGLPVVCTRFGLTVFAPEILGPKGAGSGVFWLSPRLAALQRRPWPSETEGRVLGILEGLHRDEEQLLVYRHQDGRPLEMGIVEVDDLVAGLLLVLDKAQAVGETFNLGAVRSFGVDKAVPYMAERLGLPYEEAVFPTAYRGYCLSNAKAQYLLGYQPKLSIYDIIDKGVSILQR